MCGIAGIYHYARQAQVDQAELISIRDAMLIRGPDDSGVWLSEDAFVGLAHRRLSIIDLNTRAKQPMATHDGRYQITFNGEIYNYRELKQQLIASGYQFQTTSDTEVLLYLYVEKGQTMLNDLCGMFAFAIWDSVHQGLFLARDHFGIKPLYYADDGHTIRFASQVKALLAGKAIHTTASAAGHTGYFLWGSVPEPFTLYQQIRSLPAGCAMWVDRKGASKPQAYFNLTDLYIAAEQKPTHLSFNEIQENIYSALNDSIRHHFIADVPVGVFLSAGLDSTVITNYAVQNTNAKLNTLTLGFDQYRNTELDEVPIAEKIAAYYQTQQHTQWLSKQTAIDHYPTFIQAMDQPSIDGANSYFVSRVAKQNHLKVVLSGVGGDEFLGGYPDFARLPKIVSRCQHIARIGKMMRQMTRPLVGKHFTAKYASLIEFGHSYAGAYLLSRCLLLPWQLTEVLPEKLVQKGLDELHTMPLLQQSIHGIQNPFLKVSALTAEWYMRNQLLRDVDWSSMAHSIEVRLPFVDIEFVRTIVPMLATLSSNKKMLLNNVPDLPKYLLERKKTGFNIPMAEWCIQPSSPQGMLKHNKMFAWANIVYQQFMDAR